MLAEAWRWPLAWQQTAWAGLDPRGAGRWWQAQRLQQLLQQVLPRSPLYARRRPRGAALLQDWEPIGKRELMAGFDDWATDRRITWQAAQRWLTEDADVGRPWLGRYLLWTSSGTSGQPGLFVQDAASLAAFDAIEALRLRGAAALPLPLWGLQRRFAYVGALGACYAGQVSLERLQRLPGLGQRLRMISVLEPIEAIAQALQDWQPQVLISYPSCAAALAQQQRAGRLRLRLDEIWLGGEQLAAAQRQALGQAFGCPLRNSYGASECFSIACECPQGRLHLNADWVLLEALDAQGRPVPPGEFGARCWLTNLANQVQPLLRYELGDRLRFLPGACPCGSAWPQIEVQGRADELLRLPGLRPGSQVELLPLALETLFEQGAGLSAFQLCVDARGALELRLPPSERAAYPQCRRLLLDWLDRQGARASALRLGRQPPRPEPGSGKLRRVLHTDPAHESAVCA